MGILAILGVSLAIIATLLVYLIRDPKADTPDPHPDMGPTPPEPLEPTETPPTYVHVEAVRPFDSELPAAPEPRVLITPAPEIPAPVIITPEPQPLPQPEPEPVLEADPTPESAPGAIPVLAPLVEIVKKKRARHKKPAEPVVQPKPKHKPRHTKHQDD